MINSEMQSHFAELFPFIHSLEPEVREEFFDAVTLSSFREGDILLQEGNSCGGIGFILEGTVRVYKTSEQGREITLYRIYPGEICVLAVTCLMGGISYPVIAQADVGVKVLYMPSEYFRRAIHCHEIWQKYIYRQIAYRMFDLMNVLEEVAFFTMERRLAALLLEKSEQGTVRLTHEAIAFELGSAREVISRVLKDFERRGLVALSRGKIEITNQKSLHRIG